VKPILKRLLFVDDEPAIRATLPPILRRYGFTVRVAATISQALELIAEHQFDLLLCDLNIEEEGDGYEVIRAMREINPACVTIVLTGYPDVESAIDGIRASVDDYILKPANADMLVAKLGEKLLARAPKARILTVSNDNVLLQTWSLLLESRGYDSVACNFAEALDKYTNGSYDGFILGHSLSATEKKQLVEAFRTCSSASIISMSSGFADDEEDGADHHVTPDPDVVLKCLAGIIGKKAAAERHYPVTSHDPKPIAKHGPKTPVC
jgi:DNA-binding response OmpR family regulator